MQSETKSRVDQLTSPAGHPVTVLRFEGDIASTSKEAVLGAYQALPKATTKIILLDFTKVDYINSSGIALVIQLLIEAASSGQKVVAFGLSPHFTKVFTMVGITKYAQLFPNQDRGAGRAVRVQITQNQRRGARTTIPAMNLDAIQAAIREAGFDGWLFYDHHHRDPIAGRILGLDPKAHITRRWYYLVPAAGEPRKLVHRIEQGRLDSLPGTKGVYSSWQELQGGLEAMLGDVAPHRHAVLAQQRHHVCVHGRCRHCRISAQPGQADCQLGRPRQPV